MFTVFIVSSFVIDLPAFALQEMLTGIPDGSLPDTLASIVKASYLEKLEVLVLTCLSFYSRRIFNLAQLQSPQKVLGHFHLYTAS